MAKKIKVKCPRCGSGNVSGWYEADTMHYIIQCNNCQNHKEVLNIKYVEAFPNWFEIKDEDSENKEFLAEVRNILKEELYMDVEYKEVDFEKYCKTCQYARLEEFKSPCNECLENGMNIQTSKPTEWVEKNK